MLPSIKTIIKPTSYICYENRTSTAGYSPQTNHQSTFIAPTTEHINGNHEFQSLVVPTNSTILNLDDPFSTVAQIINTPFIGYEDDDTDQISQFLNSSNGSDTLYSSSPVANGVEKEEKEEKKIYPCQMCDKKYSTMTNIYRHVRAQHNYFLCSLCMNMFKYESELKEHIQKCPRADEKKPQCIVCMQYFSNSWSLTRHIKIHISAGEW